MRARPLPPRSPGRPGLRTLPPPAGQTALAFLRGRDADGRLRELAACRTAARPLLGKLAAAFVGASLHEALGYRSLGDYGRERLGVGARTVREWARVWRRLEELPHLRGAVLAGEVGWAAARLVVGLATPETDEACLATIRGRSVRAVEAIAAAFREASHVSGALGRGVETGDGETAGAADPGSEAAERVRVRLACTPHESLLWRAAVELARRVAGEELPLWQCAEAIAAEAASACGALPPREAAEASLALAAFALAAPSAPAHAADAVASDASSGEAEDGRRHVAFPGLAWDALLRTLPVELAALAREAEGGSARAIERGLRTLIAFLQTVDLETGRILRQMQDRRLFGELGFPGIERYAVERLDVSGATARRLVALARFEHRAPEVTRAFREGRIHAFQAQVIARVADRASARAWVERAQQVTLRRLEDDADAVPRPYIAFRAPPAVAALFLAMLARAGSLGRLLAHAIATWDEVGRRFHDYADFERDGYRCVVPGCTGRANLQSHHIEFLSLGGPDEPWNRVTLCAQHHLHGVHLGVLRIQGRAPDALTFELGAEEPERFGSGDVRLS